jgi:hypothetical protein
MVLSDVVKPSRILINRFTISNPKNSVIK